MMVCILDGKGVVGTRECRQRSLAYEEVHAVEFILRAYLKDASGHPLTGAKGLLSSYSRCDSS